MLTGVVLDFEKTNPAFEKTNPAFEKTNPTGLAVACLGGGFQGALVRRDDGESGGDAASDGRGARVGGFFRVGHGVRSFSIETCLSDTRVARGDADAVGGLR